MSHLRADPPRRAEVRRQSPVWSFYRRLMQLYRTQSALVDGDFTRLPSDRDDKIYAFLRQRGRDKVLVVVNMSDRPQIVTVRNDALVGKYRDWFDSRDVRLGAVSSWNLAPWAYRVYAGSAI